MIKTIMPILLVVTFFSVGVFAQNSADDQENKIPVNSVTNPNSSEISSPLNEQQHKVLKSKVSESKPIELKVESNSKTDWAAIITQALGFLITIVIVLTGTRSSIKAVETSAIQSMDSFQKSVAAQKEIADKTVMVEVLSRNRQEWINSLRNEVASYTSHLIKT
ncbi:hypothetical protein CGI50_24665, partial [Vibrio parahaemolyticus]|uniref:hypothetical protein n=2 Tax=Vibrio parahaemolyticus TaxID=670 RepID=UPI00111FFBBC